MLTVSMKGGGPNQKGNGSSKTGSETREGVNFQEGRPRRGHKSSGKLAKRDSVLESKGKRKKETEGSVKGESSTLKKRGEPHYPRDLEGCGLQKGKKGERKSRGGIWFQDERKGGEGSEGGISLEKRLS